MLDNQFSNKKNVKMHFMLAFMFAVMAMFAINVNAATFVVNDTADVQDATPGDGICATATATCTLRAAITEANAFAGADIITLPAGTYTRGLVGSGDNANANGDYDITSDITINGAGSATTIIEANAAPNTATERVFHCFTGAGTVAINGVTIRHGNTAINSSGSGIRLESATLNFTLNNSSVILNKSAGAGGGISAISASSMTLTNSFIDNNSSGSSVAASGASGPGMQIGAVTTTTMTNTSVSNNVGNSTVASIFGGGVAILGQGTSPVSVTMTGCTVSGNSSTATGTGLAALAGGVYNQQAVLNITSSVISGNSVAGTSGFHGAIRTLASTGGAATTTITDSTISGNTATTDAPGIVNISGSTFAATTNIIRSTISGNTCANAASAGGGIQNFSAAGPPAATGPAVVNVTNSTVSGNSAAFAGGIYSDGAVATINLNYATVAANTANDATGPAGGGVYQDTTVGGVTNLKNSIVADNTGVGAPDIFGVITSQNYNHVEDVTGGTFTAGANDVTGSDPSLGALGNNGGTTNTHLPSTSSVVLNTIPSGTSDCGVAITGDQRGQSRPANGACEKGSVERLLGTPTSTATASPTFTSTSTPTNTATATSTATATPTNTPNTNCNFSNGGLNPQATTESGVAAPAGFFWSEVQHDTGNTTESNTVSGFGAIQGSNRLADDFTISQPCVLFDVKFYAYQTGSPATPSPFTAYTLQIWNGTPGAPGSTVIFGDTTTNRLQSSVDSTYFRIFNTVVPPPGSAQGTTRKIWRNTVSISLTGLTLPAGTYWFDWASTVTGGANHFHPSKTIAGARTAGPAIDNARAFDGTTWSPVLDTGNPATAPDVTQDFPFDLFGQFVGQSPTPTVTATPTATNTATATSTATFTPTPPATVCDLVENFDDVTNLPGWVQQNNSQPIGVSTWTQGNFSVFPAQGQTPTPSVSPTPSFTPAPYAAVNFNSGSGTATLSNWLLTAPVLLQNGGQLTFWTRTTNPAQFPDRLQIRMSTNGTSVNVGTTATDVGDFTTLLLDINPTYTLTGYPTDWTQFTVNLSGLGSPAKGRIAFRYFVENGGPNGANSDYIGIDTFAYHCTVATPTATNTNTATPTATATNTATPTATATAGGATPSIAGTVTYGNSNAGVKNISNALVTGTGVPNVTTTTAAQGVTGGQYTLTGFGAGNYVVSLSKTTGQNNVTSNDAALIAQHVAGTVPITSNNKKIAADTSGNNAISSNDAALIARFVAGLGGSGNTNQWRFFVPNPTFPIGASPTTRSYTAPIGNPTGQDFIGILIGEVSGNWTPTNARPAQGPERSTAVAAPKLVTPADNEVLIPVAIAGAANKGIISYEFDLRYDPSVIQPQPDVVDLAGTVSRGLTAVANANEPGLLRVVMYGAAPIDGNGVLLNLRFTAVGAPGTVSPLTFERIMFNEGDPGTVATDGTVELSAAAANQAEMTGRVVNSMGQGIANARVTLTDTTGQTRSAVSNGFGVYRFGGLTVGQTFTLTVDSKSLAFAPLTVSVTGQSVNTDMIAEQ